MSRRLGVLVLLIAVSLSGSATCPRGAIACSMMQPAVHDCCKHRTTLRADDCCCKAAHQLTSQAISTAPQRDTVSGRLVAALLHPVPCWAAAGGGLSAGNPLGHGVAPPDTPITQHTLLLL